MTVRQLFKSPITNQNSSSLLLSDLPYITTLDFHSKGRKAIKQSNLECLYVACFVLLGTTPPATCPRHRHLDNIVLHAAHPHRLTQPCSAHTFLNSHEKIPAGSTGACWQVKRNLSPQGSEQQLERNTHFTAMQTNLTVCIALGFPGTEGRQAG